jgi:hypothetical protein
MPLDLAKPSAMSDSELGALILKVCNSYPPDWTKGRTDAAIGNFIRACFTQDISPVKELHTHYTSAGLEIVALMTNGGVMRKVDTGPWIDISIPADA